MRASLCVFLSFAIVSVIAESPAANPSEQESDVTSSSSKVNVQDDVIALSNLYSRVGVGGAPQAQPVSPPGECYACIDCKTVSEYTPVKTCPYSSDFTKQNKCVVYEEKYKDSDMKYVIRGCASERNSCKEIREAYAHHVGGSTLVSCKDCEGNKCNKSSISQTFSYMTIIFFVIVTPLLTKTLSS